MFRVLAVRPSDLGFGPANCNSSDSAESRAQIVFRISAAIHDAGGQCFPVLQDLVVGFRGAHNKSPTFSDTNLGGPIGKIRGATSFF